MQHDLDFQGGLPALEAEWFAAAGGGGAGGNEPRNLPKTQPVGGGGAGGLLSNNDSGLALATWNTGQRLLELVVLVVLVTK